MAGTTIVLPAKVTITNTTNASKDSKTGKYDKGGRDIGFVPYRENFTVYIEAGKSLELEADTAGQVLYYLAQATDGLEVTQASKNT